MSTTASYASEALVGPPSRPIAVRDFIHRCSHSPALSGHDISSLNLPENHALHDECSVADLQSSLGETLSDPFKYAFLVQSHEKNMESIRASSKFTSRTGKATASGSRKRKRTDRHDTDENDLLPEVLELRSNLENIALSCWSYPPDAALFTRVQKNSDLNTLTKPKSSRSPEQETSSPLNIDEEAVLFVSTYSRLSWGNHLARSSQHVILASQTIGDLYDVIPCPSNEILQEIEQDGEIIGYDSDKLAPHRGAVICIEGLAYGDGQAEEDYSEKLIKQMELLPEKKRQQITKGPCMHDQRFVDLTVRLNEPYWLLHQGSCEHFMIVESIRMLHPNDPQKGYPLTLHIAPPIIDLCMACSRVPATLSVVGDIRLGQSPFKICRPCWTAFGEPNTQERVVVVPLPKYEHGW